MPNNKLEIELKNNKIFGPLKNWMEGQKGTTIAGLLVFDTINYQYL